MGQAHCSEKRWTLGSQGAGMAAPNWYRTQVSSHDEKGLGRIPRPWPSADAWTPHTFENSQASGFLTMFSCTVVASDVLIAQNAHNIE
ncbi:jg6240 [Pararge aegeria aegeria]|uniref:Jg6240 protein n=1 Tax=Pararge aegeria aegeria TaxID=348720 RepID=A0A8S4R9B4_9NEOP|nr:jg6240 [Pararge aegeria aegeria]